MQYSGTAGFKNTHIKKNNDLPLLHVELHGVVVVGDHGQPHQGNFFIKYCSLQPNNAISKTKPKTNKQFSV